MERRKGRHNEICASTNIITVPNSRVRRAECSEAVRNDKCIPNFCGKPEEKRLHWKP